MKFWTAKYRDRDDVTFKDEDGDVASAKEHAKSLGDLLILREATQGEIDGMKARVAQHRYALRYF